MLRRCAWQISVEGSSLRDSTWDQADLTNARADKHTNFNGASLEGAVGVSSQWQQMMYMARCETATWLARPSSRPARLVMMCIISAQIFYLPLRLNQATQQAQAAAHSQQFQRTRSFQHNLAQRQNQQMYTVSGAVPGRRYGRAR